MKAGLALMMVGVLLAGCGKPAPSAANSTAGPNSTAGANATAAPNSVPVAATAPSPSSAAEASLLAKGLSLSGAFSITQPLTCDDAVAGDAWAKRCRATANDASRNGQPAMIEIQFFDQDVNFARADATFKTALDAQSPQSVYENDNDPGIQLTNSKTGQVISFPQNCHATQGPQNSTIWCELLVTPRVMIFVGVAPKGPSVDTDPPPGTDDFNHASDLLQAVFDQVRFAL